MAELIPLFYHDVAFDQFPELKETCIKKHFSADKSLYAKVLQKNFRNKIRAQVQVDIAKLNEQLERYLENEAQNQAPATVNSASDSSEGESDESDEDMEISEDEDSMDYDPSME
ncbi:hypothetical protein CAEBREN_07937 [Caenorhabditis brenneri]|uniref:Uncharacterized protein n=1 Tax=Caenorhabditis brenneri TaxID=135651 RepID=G0NJ96_CAEBE|nr:hypothetical protein CAEBREN_07937 [Caenorhabditis brenneri]